MPPRANTVPTIVSAPARTRPAWRLGPALLMLWACGTSNAPPDPIAIDAPLTPPGPRPITCPTGMVAVLAFPSYCIDAFEASLGEGMAQSAAAAAPWVQVTHAQAQLACEQVGKRLCEINELALACGGKQGRAYPYGTTSQPGSCNGDRAAEANPSVASTGAHAACRTSDGLSDLTGNVAEWAAECAPASELATPCAGTTCCSVFGGSYLGPAESLTCAARELDELSQPAEASLPQLGFRCCLTPP